VSVCNPVTVTAGRSVVVNGTVSRTVIDWTLNRFVLSEVAGPEGRAVTVTVLGSSVSVVTGTVIVTVLVKGTATEETVLSAGTNTVVVKRTAVPEGKAGERVDARGSGGSPRVVAVLVLVLSELSLEVLRVSSWVEPLRRSIGWSVWRRERAMTLWKIAPKAAGGGAKGVLNSGELGKAWFRV
jgi:hypothetical protein